LTAPQNLDWVAASLDLARLAAEYGAQRILMVGSCAELQFDHPSRPPVARGDPTRPSSLYGAAKDALHRLTAAFAAQTNIGFVWARPFHLYGPASVRRTWLTDP
jgi:nucleoside-diphosphate-sugar epimerase